MKINAVYHIGFFPAVVKAPLPFAYECSPEWLLSFDFDGTLSIPDWDPPVTPQFFELIRVMRNSHKAMWGVNTGRSLMHTLQGLAEAGFPFLPDYVIAREREIYQPNEFGRWVSLDLWNTRCEKEHKKLFQKYRGLLKKLEQWVEEETGATWADQAEEPAGIVASTAIEMDYIVRKIDQEIERYPMLAYQRNGIYLRFNHCDWNKGTAMAEVARLFNLTNERTFAFGDSHNDLDMLDASMASLMACPANACQEVKDHVTARGGYVAHGVASHGVVEALCARFVD